MASSTSGGHYFFLVAIFLLSSAAYGQQLSTSFYATSCQSLESIVHSNVSTAIAKERRMGASLVRLFFHDCFVQGCDASVLLDNNVTKGIVSEKDAGPNVNSLRSFEVIDQIKTSVEKACPGIVSCADIVALAAREAVVALNGQTWPLLLGRRDSKTANQSQANSDLPSPSSDVTRLIAAFGAKGFTQRELVALSGAHTIGLAHCTNVDRSQVGRCTVVTADGSVMASLDEKTPEKFDSNYYKDLRANRGLLTSDRALRSSTDLDAIVAQYSTDQATFFNEFGNAMKKMSEMSLLTGANGEVRANCRRVN